jgi:hypothetical protein
MAEQWVAHGEPAVGAVLSRTGGAVRRWTTRARRATGVANQAADGLWVDLGLYALSAVFAGFTIGSNLAPHREWARIAVGGYTVAAALVLLQLVWWTVHRRSPLIWRLVLTIAAWVGVCLAPLVVEAVHGHAQEEVLTIQGGGDRLLHTGTPYLSHSAIAALPAGDRLLAYLPYQPAMAVFGLPRALHAGWWSDARVWFALVTAAALALALHLLRRAGMAPAALVRALQAATVLPICALTLATGGDDLPVLALCLLAFALAATGRLTACGLAVGAAAALKLFAWPVLVILGMHALTQRRLGRYAVPALALPVLTALPALRLDAGAVVENVFSFPLGRGLVSSPAASPLPGHLIAVYVPAGHTVADALLVLAIVLIGVWLVRHPPRTPAAAARACGWALLAALLLLPATRFGYLLYPIVFFVWAPALRPRPIPAPRPAILELYA